MVRKDVSSLEGTKFIYKKNILAISIEVGTQHGFRAGRSTMSALSAIHQEGAENVEEKSITGVLLWDLSAAFDTLCPTLMWNKLNIHANLVNFVFV